MNKKTKICVNAMVGNEANTISRMLESIAKYTDYYVIQCNGNDETQQIIDNFFRERGIPGFTYNVEWNFPGWNRDHALQVCLKSDHGCDWILRMDADERLHVDEDFDWSIFENTSIQSWNVTAQAGGSKYFRTWMWNSKLPWFFQHDKRHETIHLPDISEDFQRVNIPFGFRHLVNQDGETWSVPRKFLKDALELEIDKVVGYKVLEDRYHLWYIAKSYADCYGDHTQYPFGRIHSEEFARRAIFYFERFLNEEHNWDNTKENITFNEMSYFALLMMGESYEYLGDNQKALECYDYGTKFASRRNENLLRSARLLEKLGRYEELLEITNLMVQPERTNPFPQMAFLIEDQAYYDTGNTVKELNQKANNALTQPKISSDSVVFDFK